MKFILCLIPVGAFIVRSNGLYIPPGQSEYVSRELARPNTPLMFADVEYKRTSWPSHIVKPRVQKHAVLTKRTTDEASANRQNDVDRDVASVEQDPKIKQAAKRRRKSIDDLLEDPELHEIAQSSGYPVEELAKAKRRWRDANNAVLAFKKELAQIEKVRRVTPEEKGQLQAMRHGFPVNQPVPLRKSIDDLLGDPKLHELAQSSGYPVEELAKAKRRWLDANNAVLAFKKELAQVEKVRKVTPEEKRQLQALVKAASQQETEFRRMRHGFPVNQPVPLRKSIDDLLGDPKLHEIAQSSGYPVEELAKAKRRWLDALRAAKAFRKELAQVEKVRRVTPEEKGQLQALVKAASQQQTVFHRMSQGFPVDQRVPRRKKSIDDLIENTELVEMAKSSGYPEEELAKAKGRWLDARNAVVAFKKELAEAEKVRKVTPEEKGQLQALVKAISQQQRVFHRMSQGLPVDQRVPRRKKSIDDLMGNAELDEMAKSSGHPVEELAKAKRRWLDARNAVVAFKKELAEAEKVRKVTPEEKGQLQALVKAASQQATVFRRMSQGLPVNNIDVVALRPDAKVNEVAHPVTYTAQEIAGYNQLFLDASNTLRAFEEQMAVAQQAGHSPTPDVKAQHRALQDDFYKKKAMWFRARDGTPVERVVHKRRKPKTAPSPEPRRPGSQEQASPASPAKEDPSTTHPPLQMSGPRHLAPFFFSASHLLQGVGRQWRAMPWARYLAEPRLNRVNPAELLRAEHALP
ncbi:MAG: hypothetical protein M1826_000423 [Phylliscum demangeonii]|nr:MAG: hypothetical protein M1826_000423 [Phylliscum demangeonii]